MYNIFKPKKFIASLPEKFSFYLFSLVAGLSVIVDLAFTTKDWDIYKKIVIRSANFPANSVIRDSVAVWAMLFTWFLNLASNSLEVAVFALILKLILRIFKSTANFWKIINVILFAKLGSVLVMLPYYLFAFFNKQQAALSSNIVYSYGVLGNSSGSILSGMAKNNSNSLMIAVFFTVISTIVYWLIIVYGLKKISKRRPAKN